MPRMKDLDIDFISLVNKGANKQTVKIYKADEEPVNSDDEEFRGFFNVLKSFFTKDKKEDIKKSTYVTDFNQLVGEAVIEERIREARWALMDSLENTLLEPTITDKAGHMAIQIDAFKNYVLNTVNTVGIQKSLEQIKEIRKSKEEEEMKAEDIKKMLDDALAPIKDELKVLKGEEEAPEVDEGKGEETPPEPTQEEVIAKAIKEATEPLMNEITELKKSRRAPQSLDTNLGAGQEVKKSYIGAFEGMFN
ncbi:hypothetical protein EAI30_13630 [Romboutsia ilealis]|uniref:DUF4355 domain-containing protein n=1 Tax=Romboutsia faecis TaxID=2764597 RepID=A0ABR7JST5_9FIRM|nr:hypothetical protein [Romboutsia faecis]MBC5997967.1 hypothetical protein [Romboutsia faecis]MRN25659.1 hypothetical protein [Romboutsia ilealis]